MVNEIEETDGNGGVDFNLKDFSGNKISTGIYIYRIVQLDATNNEGEEKLGKFAIVRWDSVKKKYLQFQMELVF